MKKKITVTVRTDIFTQFNKAIKAVGLRRDTYLNELLSDELDWLEPLNPNTEKGEKKLKRIRRFLHDDFSKMNLTLNQEVATKLDRMCGKKRIPRDIFIEEFMAFLSISPEDRSYAAPLDRVHQFMNDPRTEYEKDPDEITPYDLLSISDDSVDADLKEVKELLQQVMKDSANK